tara:strand:+ start:1577 stop:1840 length:264 start_codon:yes stop_codon:yes gene_type:complete
MINWRSIKDDGLPSDPNKTYLVTDGIEISSSDITGSTTFKGKTKSFKFHGWIGDENTGEDNSCCSGQRYFDMNPTHWCPTSELNLPK